MENKSGVLARVAGLFSRRGYNIFSLAVAPSDDERFSRITIVVDVESAPLDQIIKQLDKLIPVVSITELDPSMARERELLMATLEAGPDTRGQIIQLVGVFEGKIVDVGHEPPDGGPGGRTHQAGRLRGPDPRATGSSRCSGPDGWRCLSWTGPVTTGRISWRIHRPDTTQRRQVERRWPRCTTRRMPTRASSGTARWRSSGTGPRGMPTR